MVSVKIKIGSDEALKFNEVIGDTNPIHKRYGVVPGMLLYGIAAHFFDSPVHVAMFEKMVKYGDPIEIRENDGVKIYNENGAEVFNLIGEKNMQGNHCDEHYDNMEHVGEFGLGVLEFFDNYFKSHELGKKELDEGDSRAALACMAIGALAKEFYERGKGLVILRSIEFEFLSDSIDEKKTYDLYEREEINGHDETIYVCANSDEPVARGKIDVSILGGGRK